MSYRRDPSAPVLVHFLLALLFDLNDPGDAGVIIDPNGKPKP